MVPTEERLKKKGKYLNSGFSARNRQSKDIFKSLARSVNVQMPRPTKSPVASMVKLWGRRV